MALSKTTGTGKELILALESSATAGRTFSKSYFPRGTMSDIWRYGRGGNGDYKGHSATFPEELASKAIEGWSKEGDIVLDPFAGTGTTLRSAKNLGRNYIGIEISPRYVSIANDRLRQEILL